jgi:hypothetical protein
MTTKIAHARKLCPALGIIGTLLLGATSAFAQQAAQQPGSASFVENFDKLDRSVWFISDGWNNGPHQNCTWSKNQVKVEGGALQLSFAEGQSKDRNYQCGEIHANLGHPRTARRGRHVVWGLRTGTPDAEHPTYTTLVARLVTRSVRAEDERIKKNQINNGINRKMNF